MGYQQFDMKFSQRKPPKLHKTEIDASYIESRNRGSYYIPTIDGPKHVDDWKADLYERNGIKVEDKELSNAIGKMDE